MTTGKAVLLVGGLGIGALLLYRAFGQGTVPVPPTTTGGGNFSSGPNGELLKGTVVPGDRNPQFRLVASNPVGLATQLAVGSAAYLATHPTEAKGVAKQIAWPVTTVVSGIGHVGSDIGHAIGSIF